MRLPIFFEANADLRRNYKVRGIGYNLQFNDESTVLTAYGQHSTEQTTLLFEFPGSKRTATVEPESILPGKSNYLIGKDTSRWRTNVSQYARLRYREIYDGIDRVVYGNQAQLEYDWIVRPNADPAQIRERIRGAKKLNLDPAGDLLIETDQGTLRHKKPVAYQEIDGKRVPVKAEYTLLSKTDVALRLGAYDETRILTIDPVLAYATFAGIAAAPAGMALGADDSIFIAGTVAPTGISNGQTPSVVGAGGGPSDIFVAKMDPTATTLLYMTLIGGLAPDNANGLAVDALGGAYVVGTTASADFPLLNSLKPALSPGSAAFVLKLNSAGNGLVYSTILQGNPPGSGSAADAGNAIAIDSSGNAYVTGIASSIGFPVTPAAFQQVAPNANTAFVAKISATGALLYSTYLGGGTQDRGKAIAIDFSGNAYVAGDTYSADFPLVNPVQRLKANINFSAYGAYPSMFVSKLDPSGSNLLFSTFLGGSRFESADAIAVDSGQNAYVAGATASADFPKAAPVGTTLFSTRLPPGTRNDWHTYPTDAVVVKVSTTGAGIDYLVWLNDGCQTSFSFGSCSFAYATDIVVDASGSAYVTGGLASSTPIMFPLINSQPYAAVGKYQFATKINPAASSADFSTLLGVDSTVEPNYNFYSGTTPRFKIALDSNGGPILSGGGDSLGTTPGAYKTASSSSPELYIAKMLFVDPYITLTSSKNPSMVGDTITLTASGSPLAGSPSVTFMDGPTSLGTAPYNGSASIAINLGLGVHQLYAVLNTGAFDPRNSSYILRQTVNPAQTVSTTALVASPAVFGATQGTTLSATVSGSSPTGSVTFKDGTTILGTASLAAAAASFIASNFTPGSHSIVAEYGGDVANTPSTSSPLSINVVAPPTIQITSPLEGTQFASGSTINYAVSAAADGAASVSQVEFLIDGQSLNVSTQAPYTFSYANAPPGTHALTAKVTDNFGQTTLSLPVHVTVTGSGVVYFHQDLSGNTIAATDQQGNIVYTEQYRPYGERLQNAAASQSAQITGNRQWFQGKVQDESTGLQYLGARYYDPAIGRFMGVDAAGFDENNIQSFNRYAYANNNPYRYTDPDGNAAEDILPDNALIVVAGKAIGAVAAYAVGAATGDHALKDAALDGMQENRQANVEAIAVLATMGRGGTGKGVKEGGAAKSFDSARVEAFEKAGLKDASKVEFSKIDPKTGTVVEFKGPGGAKVGYDGPHNSPGLHHDTQHISWQSAGKRSGGAERGNIPYGGERHPSRPDKRD